VAKKSSLREGLPQNLSALQRAYLVSEKASEVGFDWPNVGGVLKKLDEELREFKEALSLRSRRSIRDEFGDLLFALVNIARFLRINPEEALDKTIEKFISRFSYIETSLRKRGKSIQESNLVEMDEFWEAAKKKR
jgi:tetrapyrrole methylase family protein/MazG family protein